MKMLSSDIKFYATANYSISPTLLTPLLLNVLCQKPINRPNFAGVFTLPFQVIYQILEL
jgi:hypothetical protein